MEPREIDRVELRLVVGALGLRRDEGPIGIRTGDSWPWNVPIGAGYRVLEFEKPLDGEFYASAAFCASETNGRQS